MEYLQRKFTSIKLIEWQNYNDCWTRENRRDLIVFYSFILLLLLLMVRARLWQLKHSPQINAKPAEHAGIANNLKLHFNHIESILCTLSKSNLLRLAGQSMMRKPHASSKLRVYSNCYYLFGVIFVPPLIVAVSGADAALLFFLPLCHPLFSHFGFAVHASGFFPLTIIRLIVCFVCSLIKHFKWARVLLGHNILPECKRKNKNRSTS